MFPRHLPPRTPSPDPFDLTTHPPTRKTPTNLIKAILLLATFTGVAAIIARIAHITVEEIIHLPEITTKKGRITEAVRWIIMGGVVSGGWYACR